MGIKVEKKSQSITPFAGISFVNEAFNQCGLGHLIDSELGVRTLSGYQYSEIIRNIFHIFFCGGGCMEDITAHLRSALEEIPGNKVPSADTLLRGIKELATDNTEVVVPSSGKSYSFNINTKMNRLNIKSLIFTKQLVCGKYYDFDYDNQILEHEKYDAKRTYKHTTGYFPDIATIGDKIVYVENRDGNANVKTAQAETLKRVYDLLKENKLKINRSRMDAGSYSEEIIQVVSENSNLFYIRANRCESLTEEIRSITDWKSVEINYKNYQVATLPFTRFMQDRNFRLVVMREKNADGQADLFTGDAFNYRCILTNDHESSEKEVIEYYNQRGGSEKTFDIQNNDFGWNHLPCSDMNHNTVYLIITAMVKNFYNYFVRKTAEVFTDILPTSRIKRFIFRFISVCGKWIYQGRQWKLRLYTDRPYERLKFT
jgi:hypothetical protein